MERNGNRIIKTNVITSRHNVAERVCSVYGYTMQSSHLVIVTESERIVPITLLQCLSNKMKFQS